VGELGAGLLSLLLLPVVPAFVAGDARHHEHGEAQGIDTVFVPQLVVSVLADGLVHFTQKGIAVGHRHQTLLTLRL